MLKRDTQPKTRQDQNFPNTTASETVTLEPKSAYDGVDGPSGPFGGQVRARSGGAVMMRHFFEKKNRFLVFLRNFLEKMGVRLCWMGGDFGSRSRSRRRYACCAGVRPRLNCVLVTILAAKTLVCMIINHANNVLLKEFPPPVHLHVSIYCIQKRSSASLWSTHNAKSNSFRCRN